MTKFDYSNLNKTRYPLHISQMEIKLEQSNRDNKSIFDNFHQLEKNCCNIREQINKNKNCIVELTLKVPEQNCRIRFYEVFYLLFIDYFQLNKSTVECIMCQDGILPVAWKYYIAIMAVSEMKCEYLLKLLEEDFLESGGEHSWLIFGLDIVPEKLTKIAKLNKLLAHQPWRVKKNDINVFFII
jgi:hypothetical protein